MAQSTSNPRRRARAVGSPERKARRQARFHARRRSDGTLTRVRLRAILALAVTTAVMLATAASAKVIVRATHEEETLVLQYFCDVQGLTVEDAFVGDFRLQAVPHGRDRLAYFLEHGTVTQVFTNPATDKSVTAVASSLKGLARYRQRRRHAHDPHPFQPATAWSTERTAGHRQESGASPVRDPHRSQRHACRPRRRRLSRRPRGGPGVNRADRRLLRSRSAGADLT